MGAPRKISPRIIALSGVLSAVALVFLYAAGMIPTGWIGVTAVAGIVVAVAVSSAGYLCGLLSYIVAGVLSLLLVPGKHVAVFFLLLFGLYPLLKIRFEKKKRRMIEYLLKLCFFNIMFLVLLFLSYGALFQGNWVETVWIIPYPVIALVGSVIFLIYDLAFTKVMAILQVRLVPELRRRFP